MKGATDNNPTRIATEHEYIAWYAKALNATASEWKSTSVDAKDLMLEEWERIRASGDSLDEQEARFRAFIKANRESLSPLTHYNRLDEDGPYTGGRKVHNPGKEGYRYDIIHPETGKPCVQPARGYRFPEDTMENLISSGRILFGDDETQIVQIKEYLRDYRGALKGIVELDSRVAANALESLFDSREVFKNPKPAELFHSLFGFVVLTQSWVLDYFAGSGTTGHAVISLNREDGGRRKFILVEMEPYFDAVLLPRLKKVTFTPVWKNGRPQRLPTPEEAEVAPRVMKVLRLESYEDTLNNLETRRNQAQQDLLDDPSTRGADGFREDYLLRYMLDVEARDSLLDLEAFSDPDAYRLRVKRPGSDETREVAVDLVETFTWLIGLSVDRLEAWRTMRASTERDDEGRLRLAEDLESDPGGEHRFRAVTGTLRDGRRALVVWRRLTGDPEEDNLVLDEWFAARGFADAHPPFDMVYVNGGNNLEGLRRPEDTWRVRLIEEDFHRLMFAESTP